MSRSDRPPTLAIGLDAAEASLMWGLVEAGELPALRALAGAGRRGRVASPAWLGSGAVWPSFVTGTPPAVHGVHGEWQWNPGAMAVERSRWEHLVPFWARRGGRVAVLDVPFAPLTRVPGAIEVADWGAHDYLLGRLTVWPAPVRALVAGAGGVHPFAAGMVDAAGPADHAGLARVAASCRAGARQRGDLALRLLGEGTPDLLLVVFTELHHASHFFWHTVDPGHPDHAAGVAASPRVAGGLRDLWREIDRQIGRLVEAAGPGAGVLVFALHGMRATRGIPTILAPLLRAAGFLVERGWRARTWPERARAAAAAARRGLPAPVKRLYYRAARPAVAHRLAGPSMPVPSCDWARTVAVPLPTDQHGWVRINLCGREVAGAVEPGDYLATLDRVERILRDARDAAGRPVIEEVRRVAEAAGGTPPARLPDLVVHWSDATQVDPLALATPRLHARPIGLKFTGQHAPDGFFVWRPGHGAADTPDTVAAEQLHRLL